MIIFRLLTPSYLPGATVAKFESMAWTERYQDAGDFQLIVENDITIVNTLPLGSLISHTDTKEVMIVENHEIERAEDKTLKITLSGRSLETFAENRNAQGSDVPLYNPSTLVKNAEFSITDVPENVAFLLLKACLEPGTASASDAIPNVLIQGVVRIPDASATNIIKRGEIYSRVMGYLKVSDAGIRIVRPSGAQTTLNFVIHDGEDRRTTVIFYAQYEDLNDAKYFSSIKGYKNYAQIVTHTSARLYRDRALLSDVTGLDRRLLYIEDDQITGDFTPPLATDAIAAWGQAALDVNPTISLMEATISNTAKPKFKIHYDIGDIVTVFGEFATSQVMRVTEHILTVDKTGMHGFPSLSTL